MLLNAENAFALRTDVDGALRLDFGTHGWSSDAGLLQVGKRHHVAVIADGGPGIIMFLIDGVLCDGGAQRQFGWGRVPAALCVPQNVQINFGLQLAREVESLRVYNRALRVSEAVGNWRAG